jgi:predicted transcriptional regulator of viral defense system
MARKKNSPLLRLARRRGVFSLREAGLAGVHSQQITRLVATGVIERVTRGHYRLSELPVTELHALAMAARAVPRGVICLLSALAFHGIGTQVPADVWIAIPRRSRRPKVSKLPLRVVLFSGAAYTEGIERRRIEGQEVRVYSVAKTLADLFKHRNRIGLEVAIEALRDAWRERKFTMDALDRAARVCRVARVMRPYVEAVVS